MHLTLSPQHGLPAQPETTISVSGDVITVDGTAYDLAAVPEGGEAVPGGEHPFAGKITRQSGIIHASVRVILGETADPRQPTDLAHWSLEAADGPVDLPILRRPERDEETGP